MTVTVGDTVQAYDPVTDATYTLTATFVSADTVVAESSIDSVERPYPLATFELAIMFTNYVDAGGDPNPVFFEALWDGTGPMFYSTFIPDEDWKTGRQRWFAAPPTEYGEPVTPAPADLQGTFLGTPDTTIPTKIVGDDITLRAAAPSPDANVYEVTYLSGTPSAGHMAGVAIAHNDDLGDISFDYDETMLDQVFFPVLSEMVFLEAVWDNDDVENPIPVFTTYVPEQTWLHSGRSFRVIPANVKNAEWAPENEDFEGVPTGEDGVFLVAPLTPITTVVP